MTKNNESEGYKFVIVILAGTVSFLYYSYNYIQNTALNIYEYLSLCELISLAIILLIAYFIYFIIKGFSMEVQGENHEKLENIATKIYLINLLTFTLIIIILISTIISINLPITKNPSIHLALSVLLQIIFIFSIFIIIKKKYVKIDDSSIDFVLQILKISLNNFLLIILFIVLFWTILFFYVTHSSYQGNIELEMDEIYYKNDEQIPVLFKVTGPDSYFEITLFNLTSNNLTQMWTIKNVGPVYYKDFQKTDFLSNDLLVVSSLGNGKYTIFINTTNLIPGYYQLKCSRQQFGKYSETSGFYILDYKNESFDGLIN